MGLADARTASWDSPFDFASQALLYRPIDVAFDPDGNLVLADYLNQRIRRVNTAGIINTIAGNGNVGYSGDGGPALQASFYNPLGVAVDGMANVFVADYFNHRVRKISNVVVPNAPSNLIATPASTSQISLTWTDNSTTETGFKLERRASFEGAFTIIATLNPDTTTFLDAGLASGTQYLYRVSATSGSGDSAFSNLASATTLTLPAAPTGLAASTSPTHAQISLTWSDNSNDETEFRIERKTGVSGIYSQIAVIAANTTYYLNLGLAQGTEYFYRVRAASTAGPSAY